MSTVSIKVISWNMGESINKIENWDNELEQWDVINNGEDIIFITLQEATDEIGRNVFFQALNKKLKNYTIYQDSEGSNVPTITFHVFGFVCIKDGVNVNRIPYVGSGHPSVSSTCIYKYYVCTKPSQGFGLIVNGKKIIFIGSHFPVNTNDKLTYGLQERIEAIKKVKEEVIKNIANSLGGVDTIIWAGDMNFRIQSDGTEQLDTLLKGSIELKEYNEFTKNFQPTCRFKEFDDTVEYDKFTKDRQYDDKRIPSYCDRIIYKGNFIPIDYYSYPKDKSKYPKSIAYSDHEPVVLEGYISTSMKGGDGMSGHYKHKYYKYKSRYLSLKV
jgi:hypothetical protein